MNRTTPTHGDRRVLAVQVGARALLDRRGDARIRSLPGESASSERDGERAIDDGAARADERDHDAVVASES